MIVVDTNILAYFWIPGDQTASAVALARRDPDWRMPPLWRSEFRNVLATCLRHGVLSWDDARRIASRAEEQMQASEHGVDTIRVLDRARASRLSAYDCEFVVLAEDLRVPLVTSDRQILRAFPEIAISLEEAVSEGRQ